MSLLDRGLARLESAKLFGTTEFRFPALECAAVYRCKDLGGVSALIECVQDSLQFDLVTFNLILEHIGNLEPIYQDVLFESRQAFNRKSKRLQFLGLKELFHFCRGDREDLRSNVTGRLSCQRSHMLQSAKHALVGAVGLLFRRL